jgi:hypothetical protein
VTWTVLTGFVLLGLGLAALLVLFLGLKRELRAQTHGQREAVAALRAEVQADIQAEFESRTSESSPAPHSSGMNAGKRIHAMRLLRRGEDVAHIAAALSVPRKEVELLIRVQQTSVQRAAQAG